MFVGCTLPASAVVTTLYTAFRAIRPPGYLFSGEAHDFIEIVCVLDGTAEITANDRILTLSAGQAILHPPLEFHRIGNQTKEPLDVLILSFAAKEVEPTSTVISLSDELLERLLVLNDMIRDTFTFGADDISVHTILENKQEQAKRIKNRLQSILLEFLRTTPLAPSINRSKKAQDYATVLQVLKENLASQLSTERLSKLCRMSPSTLKKTVHDYSGMGVMTLFHEIKLQAACNFLREGASIQEVSCRLGFDNPNYFCTFFKRKFGMPPTQWKLSHLPKH